MQSTLVADMLASPACLEVHVSGNDGCGDSHQALREQPWWWPLLQHIQPRAVAFGEGNHCRSLSERNPHGPL